MANISINSENLNPIEFQGNTHALISFRAIAAGLLLTMFVMIGLTGLGLAFGGISMDEETTVRGVGMFSGIWFIASVFISLFLGSYFASRVSKFRMGRVGSVQGLVIASLFLVFFLYQLVSALGTAGIAVGSLLGKTGRVIALSAQKMENYPAVRNTISHLSEDALGDLNLRSGLQVVAEGIGSRILRGNTEGAKNYLAREAGITPTEADARIAQMKAKVDEYVSNAKEATATALRSTGWTLFFLVVLGGLAGILGGGLGSVVNFRKPLISVADIQYQTGQTG
jgi:uncharacterized membrane protein